MPAGYFQGTAILYGTNEYHSRLKVSIGVNFGNGMSILNMLWWNGHHIPKKIKTLDSRFAGMTIGRV
jgi:hypothetical protein